MLLQRQCTAAVLSRRVCCLHRFHITTTTTHQPECSCFCGPLRDLKRTKPQSGLFFSALFSLHKFVSFENRDPFAQRAEAAEFAGLSDWDKFAKIEYFRCEGWMSVVQALRWTSGEGWRGDGRWLRLLCTAASSNHIDRGQPYFPTARAPLLMKAAASSQLLGFFTP